MATEAFHKLKTDKRDLIIRESLKEFADKGYADAQTSDIAARSGISKGSLFYYFESKEELYLHLVRLTSDRYIEKMLTCRENWPGDVLERLRMMTVSGIDLLFEDPLAYRFLMGFLNGDAPVMRESLYVEMLPKFQPIMAGLFEGADTSRFRFPPDETFRVIGWVFAGIKQESAALFHSPEKPDAAKKDFMAKVDAAIECLKHGIIK